MNEHDIESEWLEFEVRSLATGSSYSHIEDILMKACRSIRRLRFAESELEKMSGPYYTSVSGEAIADLLEQIRRVE